MRKYFIIIWLSLFFNLAAQSQLPEIPHEYIGNWYNPKTNEWNYGIFEKFTIINGKPYFYDKVNVSKTGLKLTFQDKTIKPLVVSGDSTQLQIGKIKFKKVNKFLPNYIGNDTSSFYDSKFKKIDTAIISGYLRNNNLKNPFSVGLNNWLTGKEGSFYGDIDQYGFFTVKIPLLNTTQVFIDWRRSHIMGVLTPGEKYFLYKDLTTGETIFRGDNERIHNEIAKYQDYNYAFHFKNKKVEEVQALKKYERSLKDTSFLALKMAQLDSMRIVDFEFINRANLSTRSIYFINNHTDYSIASALMQKKFQLDYQINEKFSDKYMLVVKENFFSKNVEPMSLIRDNQIFLRDYLDYHSTLRFPQLADILLKMEELGQLKLTDSIKMYTIAYSKMVYANSSVNLDSLDRIYPNMNKKFNDALNNNRSLMEPFIYLEALVMNPLDDYKKIANSSIAEIFHTQNIFKEFTSRPNPINPVFFDRLISSYSNPYLKNMVISEHERLKKVAAREFKYAANVINTDYLNEAKDVDKIIAEILTPHKGKVVYMDFWGTWCGPCVEEMAYAESTKMALKDKEVVFVYLANSTSKEAWENFIKSKNLEGMNVFHYNLPQEQQSMVERKLGVNGFPTYILFDKEGKLVNNQAPRPSQLELLVHEIDKVLQ